MDEDGGAGLFKFRRGSNECNIEESGASWLYVSPAEALRGNSGARARRRMAQMLGLGPSGMKDGSAPALCPDPVQQPENSPVKKEQSCLRIREHSEDLHNTGSTATCTVKNICEKRVQYKLATTTPLQNCGMYSLGSRSIQPGEEQIQDGVSTCCVMYETQDDQVMQVEPGGCLEAAKDVTKFGLDPTNDCVFKNTCTYSIMLFPDAPRNMRSYIEIPASSGWTTAPGVDATLCGAKTMRSEQQD
eukprot:g776.t1